MTLTPTEQKDLRAGILFVPTRDFESRFEMLRDALAKGRFVPYRVEMRYDLDGFEMIGIHEDFEILVSGQKFPVYTIQYTDDGCYRCMKRQGK